MCSPLEASFFEMEYYSPATQLRSYQAGQLTYSHFSRADLVLLGVCLFVLRFYGPVNPMGSCQARSVYLTTHLLGRLSPLSG